jgi:hypothetical protein
MASNARNVARALPPLNPQGMAPGGFGGVPSTFGAQALGGTSPLVSSYQQWTQGRPYGSNMPRDWQTFLSGAFGPLSPLEPIGIDTPDPNSGRPEPRRFTYPVAWNMPVGSPGSEGLKLVPFGTLRAMADTYSVARACISVRKQEILGLEWNIAPTREAEKKMGGGVSGARKDFESRRAEAIAFFENPDPGKFRSFTTWLSALLEDILVVDALSLYMQPTRLPGKGLLGSNLKALCLIDGTTVRPLLDVQGGTPMPPNVAYQIYNFGVPRVDLSTAIAGTDIEDADPDELEAEYRGDQLLYLPYEQRDWTPYGFACIEKALVPILSGLQKQQYQLDYFSEGSIPGIFISSGDASATPNQLRTLQDALNAMAGDPAWKHKIIVLPGGSRIEPMRPVPLADQFDEVVMTQVCMAFDVMPMELGIAPKVSTTMSPGASNQMAKASQSINERKALKPLLLWLKENVFDFVLQKVCGQEDMQWTWEGLEEGEDRQSLIQNLINQVEHGLMSIDEARVELGEQPWGLPLTSDPVWATATGIVPVGAIDPLSGRPMGEQLALPTQAGIATGGPAPGAAKPGAKPPTQGSSPVKPPTAPAKTPAKPSSPTASIPAKPSSASKPTRPAGTGTPAHASSDAGSKPANSTGRARVKPAVNKMAALREIDLVRRRLLKGLNIEGWTFEFTPPDAVEILRSGEGDVVARARAIVKSQDHLGARDEVIEDQINYVTSSLNVLAQGVRSGAVGHMEFIDKGTSLMRSGIRSGLFAGASLALAQRPAVARKDDGEYDPQQILDGPYGQYLNDLSQNLGQEQGDFLQGLLQDLLAAGALLGSLVSRFGLYGSQVRSAFEQGYGTSIFAADPNAWLVWHTTSSRPCALCAPRDGRTYNASTLPGWPGDGGFGGTSVSAASMGMCMGGPNCKCYLEAVDNGQSSIGTNTLQDYGADLAASRQRLNQLEQDIRAAREAFLASLPDQARARALARDQASSLMDDAGGFTGKKKKKKKGKKDGDKDVVNDHHPDLPPSAKEAEEATEVTHEDHGGYSLPDKTHHVYAYLARHYPKDDLEWVLKAVWRGPMDVPLDDIDMARRAGGARDENKVRMIATAIDDGMKLDPLVLVDVPGEDKLQIADGWHRTAAIEHTGGKSASAWVGTVGADSGFSAAELGRDKLNH